MKKIAQVNNSRSSHFKRIGRGSLVNKLIDKLPVELHLPFYQYCGPGTRLEERLARGDRGINPLDRACREHDISYSQSKELHSRHLADRQLQKEAWKRVKASDASIGERAAALLVGGIMKIKQALGMGLRRRTRGRKKRPQTKRKTTFGTGIRKTAKKKTKRKTKTTGRLIKTPKKLGGFIFTVPMILGALGALGMLTFLFSFFFLNDRGCYRFRCRGNSCRRKKHQ